MFYIRPHTVYSLTNQPANQPTKWSRVFLEKLIGLQLFKKFLTFYGTKMFITCHLPLSRERRIKSTHSHSTSLRSILMVSSQLCIGLPSSLFPPGLPTKTMYRLIYTILKYKHFITLKRHAIECLEFKFVH